MDFHHDLTRHTHRAPARTTRNDFPIELSPPTSDSKTLKAGLISHIAELLVWLLS